LLRGVVAIKDGVIKPRECEKEELGEYLKCLCGKKVCQVHEQVLIIKCRHCKRYILIKPDRANGGHEIDFK